MSVGEFAQVRTLLAALFREGLQAVHGRRCVAQHLQANTQTGEIAVIAIGKAACAMLEGAVDVLAGAISRALIISPAGAATCLPADSRIRHICGNHPIPDIDSLAAGATLLSFIESLPPHCRLLFLISGGTSSLVEVTQPGLDLTELQAVNHWLLGSGLDIVQMNHVRAALSQIKGGRLRHFIGQRDARVLLLSDVPGDDPAVIGSGLLQPAASMPADLPALPGWLQALLDRCLATPLSGNGIGHSIVGNNRIALEAIVAGARRQGWQATCMDKPLVGDVEQVADWLVTQLQSAAPGLYVWGGETTVVLPEHPGEGGRNQQLALAVARQLPADLPVVLLCAGSDGRDGNSEAAGAIVDGQTVLRGARRGLDAADCLRRAAAGMFLRASEDCLVTGPTGTNVMDIVIAVKLAESVDARPV